MRAFVVIVSTAMALASAAVQGQQSAPAGAAQFVYPAKGQAPELQQKDETECAAWAVQQSNYDPAHPPATAVAQPAPVAGSGARVKGAATGAAIGAATGGDAGDAAVAGAVAGGVVRRNKNRRAAAQANQASAQQQQAAMAGYQKARATCLEGRGYTVK